MWIYNNDYSKWFTTDDKLSKTDFDFLKQELQSTRLYSKCLSGATYLPINNLTNIYDILTDYEPRSWYISTLGSVYSVSTIPPQSATPITATSSYDYYTKYLSEYGLTLKNLFTPNRLIKDSLKNYYYVDVATTESIDFSTITPNYKIDGVRLLEGHRVLIKNQTTSVVLLSSVDPNSYFTGNYTITQNIGATVEYEYYNEDNGIYLYTNGNFTKTTDLDDYQQCTRYSVNVKLGDANKGKQFHLSRLLDGYYPTTSLNQPIEFKENHNWILRNRVDYNNLFEINYYDVIKHGSQSYTLDGITYSIPERSISVGEFGIILNTQETKSNIIQNKYKVNLRSVTQTTKHYWICGDDNILLKVRKHDFNIERILLEDIPTILPQTIKTNLHSVSFINDLKGVVVGELNTILFTKNGGYLWERIEIEDFSSYNYNRVLYSTDNNFYIAGDNGILIEMIDSISGWTAYKRRISKKIDNEDEYLLVDNINDLYKTTLTNWGLSYSYNTQSISSNKELLFLAANNGNIIAYDINGIFNELSNDFIYFDFGQNYSDIKNITRRDNTNYFYFTGTNPITSQDGIFSFDINNFQYLGIGNSYSNTSLGLTGASFEIEIYPNETFDYNGNELLICGNTSLLQYSTYSTPINFSDLDSTFEEKLKSKLLILDYDIASKLNFFTDDGDYRLPESITFSDSSIATSYLTFQPSVIGATAPSYLTQSQNNWTTYWIDRQKTFEFYSSSPLDDSSEVLISTTFLYSLISSSMSITGANITGSSSQISYLAPMITYATQSRYSGIGYPSISEPTSSHDVYLYDYLMVVKLSSITASVGDVLRLESSVVDADLIVNKIYTGTTYSYAYMFSEFNQNIIKDLQSTTNPVTLTNLNLYSTVNEFENRFNKHPLSNAYEVGYTNSTIEISAQFNNLTSYYNLGTDIIAGTTYSMVYTSGFLNFGYSPTYNLLDYLERINNSGDPNPTFYATKEYVAMPEYRGIPVGSLTPTTAYIDYNGMTESHDYRSQGNKILFGTGLKLEWDSIFLNTFVDVNIYQSTGTYSSERLLVMNKYYDSDNDAYVIEFHKRLTFNLTYVISYIDIISRRKLSQISEDLQELNNIQRTRGKTTEIYSGYAYTNYENELNFKIPTDSYAKILLSDADTIQQLTAIIYIDFKNELSMNITKLAKEYNISIFNTLDFGGKLYISCYEPHGLLTGDGAVLEFNGATGSSEELNHQYFGYHVITKVSDYDFYTDVNYGTIPLVGNDTGYVKYTKQDPFFNYQPVDIIDLGVDKKGKQSIELSIDNLKLSGDEYSLINVDFDKYRFRLIDGMNIETLSLSYPWILEAEISGAIIGLNGSELVWYDGTWTCGRWFGGIWQSGVWMYGDWYNGTWNSNKITDKIISVDVNEKTSDPSMSFWYNGRWFDGIWNNGTWYNGRRYAGTWNNGNWHNGIWNDGTWNNGFFTGGIWVLGNWNGGVFNCDNNPAYWLDGKWYGGDFENGMWYNGSWEQKYSLSRFGVNAYNSRTATWHGGKWISGSFYSKLNIDDNGNPQVSDVHKYSIWKTGTWLSGEWYGGIAYNMDFKTGTWYGGILDEIQVIGIDTINNTFQLNGIFKYNTGDEIYIIDNEINGANSVFGSNLSPTKYKILYQTEDDVTKITTIYVDQDLSLIGSSVTSPVETGLRIVSKFKNLNWKSGIWTNGLFENGVWEGGIWYSGVFSGTWS